MSDSYERMKAQKDAIIARQEESREREMLNLIDERDYAEQWADKLARLISAVTGFEIGEHSSVNCPWQKAAEALEGILPGELGDGSQQTMWAEMKPDCYGGQSCDQVIPQWSCYSDGDKDSEDGLQTLDLDARTFPPGTKVTVSVPVCPECLEAREPTFPTPAEGTIYTGPCRCGFDWDAWTLNKYS